jgi:hypothetical protein
MKRFVVAVCAVLCLAAAPVQAAQAAAATPTPRALALTKRYIAALHVDDSMKPMMQSMMGPMMDEQARAFPNMTDEQRKAVHETVEEFVAGDMMSVVIERMTPIYATTFSEEELQAMVDFYESPMGQSIIGKMPRMGPAMAQLMVEMMPEIRATMTRRLCEKLHCDAAPAPKAHSS